MKVPVFSIALPVAGSARAMGSDPNVADHYCLRCLAPAALGQAECTGCGNSFEGAGRFGLAAGSPPSRDFAFLFAQPCAAGNGRDTAAA